MLNGTFQFNFVDDKKLNYLALGDSYTIGESVDIIDRFPVQLVNKLKFDGYDFYMPDIVAKTGWTTDELLSGIEDIELKKNYDLVTLLIGVNNQYRGRDIDNYKEEFEELLQKAIAFSGDKKEKVIVVSIPDYGVTPFGKKKGRKKIGNEIDQFNAANLAIAKKYEIAYVDVTEVSRTAYRKTNLVAKDGLHPSGEMYSLWVVRILPVAKEILTETK
jgi:lysophospholipase L1-like esterase